MRTLNLGILAHVDAGKTTLTERLLHAASVIDEIGSVDDGSTQTDSLALERQRGITIRRRVVRRRRRHGEPDRHPRPPGFHRRGGAGAGRARRRRVDGLRRRGRAGADPRAYADPAAPGDPYPYLREQDRPRRRPVRTRAAEHLRKTGTGDRSDGIGRRSRHPRRPLHALRRRRRRIHLQDGRTLCRPGRRVPGRVRRRRGGHLVPAASRRACGADGAALVHPVFFGSAATGAGVDSLVSGITELLPAAGGDADGPVSGTVFKIERGPEGEKVSYVRVHRDRRFRAGLGRPAGFGRRGPDREALGARRGPGRRRPRRAASDPGAPPFRPADAGDGRRSAPPRRERGAARTAPSSSSPSRTP